MHQLFARRLCARGLLCLCACLSLACNSNPYQYGKFYPAGVEPPPLVVEHGGPSERLDKLRHIVQFPARLFSFGREHNAEEMARQTEDQVIEYLEQNDLYDVYVAVNQYEPKDQWRRLRENDRIAPGWRYSVGALSVVGYFLLPGRVFGRDSYNPYTNTLSINSSDPTRALFEAAYAKDLHYQKYPGNYAAMSSMPVLSMVHQTRAASDVVGYLQTQEEWELEKRAYPRLYAQIGARSAKIAGPFVPGLAGPVLGLGGSIVGHAAGRIVAGKRDKEIELVKAEREQNAAILAELRGEDDIELVDGVSETGDAASGHVDQTPYFAEPAMNPDELE
ncbi:MAG: hypothetical protein EHM42_05365 [Planctomycetaceae bacterium]|nr:MAG: hypothetical protein EHM42_05365 [Planctomycetaceae bacterium]